VSPGNPMKAGAGMAPLATRYDSALAQARRAPIRVTAIERQFGTRFTVETLRALTRRYPRRRFVWLMGADNLAQFHRWKDWRAIARMVPIAVAARPGYDGPAMASPAMAWLGRFRRSAASLEHRAAWSAPALVILRFDPDPRSATAIRQADPDWASRFTGVGPSSSTLRDRLTLRPLEPTS